ncbi:PID-CTERM protein-sorting domain-containing protein [Hymenobacter antarcticus]|uniref:Uncharacterized protein n=1 Tax=Hymenobacter antarcticus TaxID=486270 RepID=A0ABP7PQG8_9BACT
MKNLLTMIILAGGVCLLAAAAAKAQPGSGGPTPGAAPTSIPIDGGSALLLAGGVGYALKRLRGRPNWWRKK